MSSQEYLKALAYELRQRKHSEDMVSSTLQEVHSHLAVSGESGEEAFGQPRDYAASFLREPLCPSVPALGGLPPDS
ncbi:HAAS signaling domain-containing protein [Arthrobacter nitrophenolicus]|uniref:HAAS signaling domain-containing protein n=1 Tax=Arthrobacter nitrophenolicus TaxID=683150 RepID=UPI001268BF4C